MPEPTNYDRAMLLLSTAPVSEEARVRALLAIADELKGLRVLYEGTIRTSTEIISAIAKARDGVDADFESDSDELAKTILEKLVEQQR